MPTFAASDKKVSLKIIATTDVHGNFFPENFITRQPWAGSMARVATYVDSMRRAYGPDNVILLDNGDLLQGQPTAYYYNFIDTVSPHIGAEIYNYLKIDAATLGNHDVETGHAVYDRVIAQTHAPILGANVIDTSTGRPYLPPYTIINRGGLKVAILGLITPAIPAWLPENLWEGLRFDDMEATARRYVEEIRTRENPDLLIGLFHSGADYTHTTDEFMENASVYVARNVPGFDAVFFGHDHKRLCERIVNVAGEDVVVINPANNAICVGVATVDVTLRADGSMKEKKIDGRLVNISSLYPSAKYLSNFQDQRNEVAAFVDRQISRSDGLFASADAFFGPSAFMDLIHRLQLEISGADISLAAPLSFDGIIAPGPLHVSDMFTLYKYENMLYTMWLTGQELKDYLEESYALWTRQMQSPDEHLILFESDDPTPADNRLKHASYNFDSAYGINYIVDVTRPAGQKITITSMADGTPFDLSRRYTVAVNSYRGNGGGDLLTKGAGIPRKDLSSRIVRSTDKDLRYYLLRSVEQKESLAPSVSNNWKFIPEGMVEKAIERDYELLFGRDALKEQK